MPPLIGSTGMIHGWIQLKTTWICTYSTPHFLWSPQAWMIMYKRECPLNPFTYFPLCCPPHLCTMLQLVDLPPVPPPCAPLPKKRAPPPHPSSERPVVPSLHRLHQTLFPPTLQKRHQTYALPSHLCWCLAVAVTHMGLRSEKRTCLRLGLESRVEHAKPLPLERIVQTIGGFHSITLHWGLFFATLIPRDPSYLPKARCD
mmetsp:Transcript_5483/g.8520  ORF Transcript_5483/g.8520 Transcript_5483/m.8520 type:complete len:201 (+) Transcript_5483:1183-1785(+)